MNNEQAENSFVPPHGNISGRTGTSVCLCVCVSVVLAGAVFGPMAAAPDVICLSVRKGFSTRQEEEDEEKLRSRIEREEKLLRGNWNVTFSTSLLLHPIVLNAPCAALCDT